MGNFIFINCPQWIFISQIVLVAAMNHTLLVSPLFAAAEYSDFSKSCLQSFQVLICVLDTDDELEFGDDFEKCDLQTLCDNLIEHPDFNSSATFAAAVLKVMTTHTGGDIEVSIAKLNFESSCCLIP
jgi:hypothetical protein